MLDHEEATDSRPEELLADPRTGRSQAHEPQGECLRSGDRWPLQQSGGGEGGDERLRPIDGNTEADRDVAELPEPVATVHQLQQRVQGTVRIGDDDSVGGVEPELEVVVIAAQQGQMGLEPESVTEVRRRRVEGLHGASVRPGGSPWSGIHRTTCPPGRERNRAGSRLG